MRYVTVTPASAQSWELFFVWANEDYQNYIFLAYHKIVFGTALWMAWQSIEKYYKSFLLKYGGVNTAPMTHDIGRLVDKAKKLGEYSLLNLDDDENEWLSDVSAPIDDPKSEARNADMRYGSSLRIENLFCKRFITVGKKLRKLILGEQEYNKFEFPGSWVQSGGGFTGKNEPSNYYRKVIIPILLTS